MDQFLSAQTLEIDDDKHEALIAALDEMRSGKIVHRPLGELFDVGDPVSCPRAFNMEIWKCDTACCIGGLASILRPSVDFLSGNTNDLEDLFFPEDIEDYDSITLEQGVAALTNYLTRGSADWLEVVAEQSPKPTRYGAPSFSTTLAMARKAAEERA